MKKVAIFRNHLLPISETFIKEQARALTSWEPVFVGYTRVPDGLDLDGLDVRIIPGMKPGTVARYALRLRQLFDLPHPAAVSALRRTGASLVHAHFGNDATQIWPSVKAAGLPMLVTLHGADINIHREWWEDGHGGLLQRAYPRRLLRMAREPKVHFVAVSEAIKRRAIEYGIPEDKLTTCYIGVDTDQFKPEGLPIDRRRSRILFVGRMVENKGPTLLVHAFSKVRKRVLDAELVMIGDGPMLESVRNLAQTLGVPVEFLGKQNADEVRAQLHEARVLCLPSMTVANGASEGFGLVLLEAQACGVPVVSSAQRGTPEGLQDERTGFSFQEGDIAGCAIRIESILSGAVDISAMSSNARLHVASNFAISRLSNNLEKLYKSFGISTQ